jgi:thiamine-monophosphate kinase
MKLSDLGEFGLIHRIQKLSSRTAPGMVVGIGDDAAALTVSPNSLLLATTDMLIEGAHFDLSYTDFYSLGWKSASVNLSDIAAMGGLPRFCLTSLGIPSRVAVERISEFYRGFNALLRIHKTVLAGGDTCSSRNGLVISVTALGEVIKNRIVTRAGARPGDKIFVTGTLGDAAAGLELLKYSVKRQGSGVQGSGIKKLMEKHLRPAPRVAEGRAIALSGCARAMIDVSDGLSSDLSHLCEQSGVGAVIHADKIPFSPELLKSTAHLKKNPLYYALSGGEDYELLFAVPPERVKRLRSLNIDITEIGETTRARGLIIVDDKNRKKRLAATGYNHFSRSVL